LGAWTFCGFTTLLAYGYAFIRWAYHRLASEILRRRGWQVSLIPLLYFVVTTATFGFWLGVMLYAMAWLFEHWDAHMSDIVAAFPRLHPNWTLLVFLVVGLALRRASSNSTAGFREVYANSQWLAMYVQLIPVFPALMVVYLYIH
jgi:hypothetical protein